MLLNMKSVVIPNCKKGQTDATEGVLYNLLHEMNSCSSVICVSLLRKEGRSSGFAVQPQVIKLMRVSLLGMSAGRLLRLVSGRVPRSTLNMICMGLVTSEHTQTDQRFVW